MKVVVASITTNHLTTKLNADLISDTVTDAKYVII